MPMQLAQNLQQAQATAWIDERRASRRHLGLPVMVGSIHSRAILAHMVDISSLGCRIEGQTELVVGSFGAIEVKGFTIIEGWVAWKREAEFAVEFAHPLPDPIVSHLAAFVR